MAIVRWVPLIIGIVLIFFQYKGNVAWKEAQERERIFYNEREIEIYGSKDDSFISGKNGLLSGRPLIEVFGYHMGKNIIGIIGVLFVMGSIRAIYLADNRASESAEAKRIRNHELEKAEKDIRSITVDEDISKMDIVAIDIADLPKVNTRHTGDHGELDEEADDSDPSASSSQAETSAPDESSDEELRRFIDDLKTRRGIVDDDDSPR